MEMNDFYMALSGKRTSKNACSQVMPVTMGVSLKPRHSSKAAKKYNMASTKSLRLSPSSRHRFVKAQATYCSPCLFKYVFKCRGKWHTKKGGPRQQNWCELCLQPICTRCWELWHSSGTLVRASIFEDNC